MRRFVYLLAAILVSAAFASGFALAAHAARTVEPGDRTSAEESPCVIDADHWASPSRLLLGETVDVTLTVRAVCPREAMPLHVALVLDGSGAMAGEPGRLTKRAATDLVRGLEMGRFPDTQVGVAEFDATARTLSPLSDDEARVLAAIQSSRARPGARIDAGILEGIEVLRQGRGDAMDITEVMVLLSNARSSAGCTPVLQAARQARGQGILMIAVCVGSGCDEQCTRQVASSPRYYFRGEDAGALQDLVQQMLESLLRHTRMRLVIEEALSTDMRYMPDSAKPALSIPPEGDRLLRWDSEWVPTNGVTFTFRVEPLTAGHLPLSDRAQGTLIDARGREKAWAFRVPWVTVLDPQVLPTPGGTPTWTPTVTAVSSATPPPTATGALPPARVFAPMVLRRAE